ncbi:MAG: tRNA uridine-5-carboxymethylaminomethyl(34) synthesis GTPase MnmE [Ruminococcaceae bacterium]|nr:tRNA uridine-5-carboxymethylaminomethyl(34) synthesis GTPase MnmE [Oscillospiraceae bacterium]
MQNRTIAAISTPLGEGGIGIIRISGPDAISIAEKIFRAKSGKKIGEQKGYTALFGNAVDGDENIDTAVCLIFRAPHSFTGEDTVEISVHSGRFVIKRVLRAAISAGADSAAPGEFTKRAFLNGKLDLTQAEGIMSLIAAEGEGQFRLASGAVSGKISKEIAATEEKLVSAAASIAYFADEPDEILPELNTENFGAMLLSCEQSLKDMLSSYDAGKVIREGIDTAIVGKPNVGKSTLMNLLVGSTRSIVTDVAGTTRDIIEDTVRVGEITLRLSDTAGIHKTDDIVETVGVNLAKSKIDEAELILAVFDSTAPLDNDDKRLIEQIKDKKTIVIINKSDIGGSLNAEDFGGLPTVTVSAKTGTGKAELTAAIEKLTNVCFLNPDSAVLGSERQRDCAVRALSAVTAARDALIMGETIDAVGVCVDDALAALFELTGKRATNVVTDEVFKKFCVGK